MKKHLLEHLLIVAVIGPTVSPGIARASDSNRRAVGSLDSRS